MCQYRRDNRWFSWLLFLLFLGLKLGQFGMVATWGWWWIFAPIWGGAIWAGIDGAISYELKARREKKSCNQ